ncbi:zinc-ribbon domain-containing protein, partial [Candidatus Hodarchaeum mangrovi]
MPRFCSNCGYQVEADSVFCDTCGFDLTSRNDFNHNLKSSHPDKTVIRAKFPLNYDYYRRSPPKFTKNLTLGIILSVILFLTGVLVIPLLMNQDSYHHNSNTTQPEIIGEKIYQIDEDSALSNIFLNITIPHGSVHIYITQSEILFGSYIEIIGFPHQSVEDASNFFETREENASYLYLTSDDSFEYNVWITISSLTIISIITVLEEGDIYLDAYQAILSSLFTHSSQGEIFISIADSLIISSDYFSKFHCYIGNGNLIVFHYNLVYESNDFYWELGSDS